MLPFSEQGRLIHSKESKNTTRHMCARTYPQRAQVRVSHLDTQPKHSVYAPALPAVNDLDCI